VVDEEDEEGEEGEDGGRGCRPEYKSNGTSVNDDLWYVPPSAPPCFTTRPRNCWSGDMSVYWVEPYGYCGNQLPNPVVVPASLLTGQERLMSRDRVKLFLELPVSAFHFGRQRNAVRGASTLIWNMV
jgi:hypothetical protein